METVTPSSVEPLLAQVPRRALPIGQDAPRSSSPENCGVQRFTKAREKWDLTVISTVLYR